MLLAACVALCGLLSAPVHAAKRFVDPSNPLARDVGHGSPAMPYRTLSHAMSQLQPGDHLVIAAGVYREPLIFPQRADWAGAPRTVVEGWGKVIIKGSVPASSGWNALGNGRYMRPWPKETAQVLINGVPMQQIGGSLFGAAPPPRIWPGRKAGDQNSMAPGRFYFEKLSASSGNLYIRPEQGDLKGLSIEISTLPHTLLAKNVANVTVRNLEFQHGNTSPIDRNGLVLMTGNNNVMDRVRVTLADSIGIEMEGNDNKLTNSSANHSGQLGLKARGSRMFITNTETSGNNTRGFLKWWEAGGAKFVGAGGLQDSVVSGHKAIGNVGDGLWFDWLNRNNRIEKGVFAHNTGFGIHYESSHGATITDNVVVGNRQRGIYLLHSAKSVVAFNLVVGNKLQGVVVVDEGRRDPTGQLDMTPLDNKVFGNVIAWNHGALTLPHALASNFSDANVFVGETALTTFQQGWEVTLPNLAQWMASTGRDRASRYFNMPAVAAATVSPSATPALTPVFTPVATAETVNSVVGWYKAFRPGTPVMPLAPEWLAFLPPGPLRDRAGPAL